MAHSSKTAFAKALAEYGLESLKDQFIKRGWETYNDFAFSTSDPSGKDPQAFQKEVVEDILAKDGKEKHLIPKLRRLYAQAYIFASKAMNDEAEPRGVEEKFHMHPADRSTRTDALRARITGWQLADQNLPATTLVDKMATILQKDTVKYIAWNKCISKQQELVEEPEVKGCVLHQMDSFFKMLPPIRPLHSVASFCGITPSGAGLVPGISPGL